MISLILRSTARTIVIAESVTADALFFSTTKTLRQQDCARDRLSISSVTSRARSGLRRDLLLCRTTFRDAAPQLTFRKRMFWWRCATSPKEATHLFRNRLLLASGQQRRN